jgi:2-oxoglutarate dehydrogenase E2 component (dihydrolipoamide succinyltransferase)
MSIELKIPDVGESIREVQIGRWLKKEGDRVEQDEDLVQLETDKASMELPAPAAGVLAKILKKEGETVAVGEVIGHLEKAATATSKQDGKAGVAKGEPASEKALEKERPKKEPQPNEPIRREPVPKELDHEIGAKESVRRESAQKEAAHKEGPEAGEAIHVTPAARRALREHGLAAADIDTDRPTLRAKDVLRYVEKQRTHKPSEAKAKPETVDIATATSKQEERQENRPSADGELEEIVPMSLIRRRIAERLVQAQQQAALLTTFNEIDMSAVQELRETYREPFQQKYGIKLGFMSFFVKAVVDALKQQPELNTEIRDGQIVYRHYYHIGIAIGSAKGLVVPVLRFAERLSFAEIEQAIDDFARRAAENKLGPNELQGGTFTITNGGVYGSLLSTPIVNPPQSGVLGMHAIQDRPVAREGQVVIRPMMYVALTYDHRIVDGREAVTFLKRVKETIEEPSRMLLEV